VTIKNTFISFEPGDLNIPFDLYRPGKTYDSTGGATIELGPLMATGFCSVAVSRGIEEILGATSEGDKKQKLKIYGDVDVQFEDIIVTELGRLKVVVPPDKEKSRPMMQIVYVTGFGRQQ